jgi:ketol-acid reductoisomerase
MSVKVYLDEDADLLDLQNKFCAVIGFGSQGHAQALNLKDSGIGVIVGLYQGSKSIPIAHGYGFRVLDVAEAAEKADVVFFATLIEINRCQLPIWLCVRFSTQKTSQSSKRIGIP